MIQTFDTPIHTNDQSLEKVLSTGLPVLLLFTNGRLPVELDQAVARLAKENAGQLLVADLNAGDNPAAVKRFGISQAPAVVTVRGGNLLSKSERIGAHDLEMHTMYLLGRGPQPEEKAASRSAQKGSPQGAGSSQAQSPSDAAVRSVSDRTFESEVLGSSQPVLVDFWAPWCGPCKMTEPMVERLAREMKGRVWVAKVNVDENPALSQRFGVQGIPTMMLVKAGQVVDRWSGALPEPAFRSRVMPKI
jgi:thioredoxin 1